MQCKEWDDANSKLFKESHDEAVHKNSCKSRLYELISASLDSCEYDDKCLSLCHSNGVICRYGRKWNGTLWKLWAPQSPAAMLPVRLRSDIFHAFWGTRKNQPANKLVFMVPEAGLEPARCCHRQILSLVRLPFRHSGILVIILSYRLPYRQWKNGGST